MNRTPIQWTEYSSNPIRAVNLDTGRKGWYCTKVTAGCDGCYSERLNLRFGNGMTFTSDNLTRAEFYLDYREFDAWKALKTPSKIFVEDMGDLYHSRVTDEMILAVHWGMREAPWHTYQTLTKRPLRMLNFQQRYFPDGFPPYVWFGTSVEDNRVVKRGDILRRVRGEGKRFYSCEPIVGPLDDISLVDIDWVIAGGESGPNHRPMDLDWPRFLRDQCELRDIPFFFKQVGGVKPTSGGSLLDGQEIKQFPTLHLRTPRT